MQTETLTMSDGANIYLANYATDAAPAGVIQFVHGFGEHAGRYAELAERFNAKGMAFVMHDQRGHGKTPGKRGVSPSYDKLLDDVEAVRARIGEIYPNTPVVLYGHSMGGNVSLNYLISRTQKQHVCAVIGCPWLRLYKPFPAAVLAFASVFGKLSKNMTAVNKVDIKTLTHDEDLVRKTSEDVAYHGILSLRLFAQITARGEHAISHARIITLPAFLICADEDKLVSTPAVEALAANTGENVIFKKYEGLYHELHNEIERERVFDDVYAFISPYCGK